MSEYSLIWFSGGFFLTLILVILLKNPWMLWLFRVFAIVDALSIPGLVISTSFFKETADLASESLTEPYIWLSFFLSLLFLLLSFHKSIDSYIEKSNTNL